jgi:hypothetical protein
MQNKMHLIIGLFFGMLLGNATLLHAAEETPAATSQADTSEDQTAEEMLAAEAALEAQQAKSEEPANESTNPLDDATPETAGANTPSADDEDFVPTIQISEDLSVSFPVDI